MAPRFLLLGFGLAATTAIGAASALPGAPSTDYAAEAAAVRSMMEASRRPNEEQAPDISRSSLANAKVVTPQAEHSLSELDAQLFRSSERVASELAAEELRGKRASLTATKSSELDEDRQHRAARFFAMHGLSSVGKLLGEEVSSEEQQQLEREREHEEALSRSSSSTGSASFRGASVKAVPTVASLSKPSASLDLDMDLEDDESEKEERNRWKAVDALRHRHAHM